MNVALTGIDGRYELEAMRPTETGYVAVDDMLALSDIPLLWSISGKAQQDEIYADTSQQALQEWCEPRVINGLEVFWQLPESPYAVATMDHGQWKAGIQASDGHRVAWFTCPTMARAWLTLLPQEGPVGMRDALQAYLHTPLAPHHSGGTWWLPLTAHQILASLRKESIRLHCGVRLQRDGLRLSCSSDSSTDHHAPGAGGRCRYPGHGPQGACRDREGTVTPSCRTIEHGGGTNRERQADGSLLERPASQ